MIGRNWFYFWFPFTVIRLAWAPRLQRNCFNFGSNRFSFAFSKSKFVRLNSREISSFLAIHIVTRPVNLRRKNTQKRSMQSKNRSTWRNEWLLSCKMNRADFRNCRGFQNVGPSDSPVFLCRRFKKTFSPFIKIQRCVFQEMLAHHGHTYRSLMGIQILELLHLSLPVFFCNNFAVLVSSRFLSPRLVAFPTHCQWLQLLWLVPADAMVKSKGTSHDFKNCTLCTWGLSPCWVQILLSERPQFRTCAIWSVDLFVSDFLKSEDVHEI